MHASSVQEPFDSLDWIFETKLDGYRAIAMIDSAGKARIWSRNRLPLEPKFPMVLNAAAQLKLRSTILDGEIVALDYPAVSIAPTMTETPDCPVFTRRRLPWKIASQSI
jgi:ATP-dependent DNA ligase